MAVVRFVLYAIVGILFVAKVSDWNLVIAVVVINFFSDTFGSYSGGLVAPLVADIVGKKILVKQKDLLVVYQKSSIWLPNL